MTSRTHAWPIRALAGNAHHWALLPAIFMVFFFFVAFLVWSVVVSFTNSTLLPRFDSLSLANYERLLHTARWWVAYSNMFILWGVVVVASIFIGYCLAALLDKPIRREGLFRTAFLYPLALSFIVTGVAWQWILNPTVGIQQAVRSMGLESFIFDWIVRSDRAIYTVAMVLIWQSSGLAMAIFLPALRAVNPDLWKATKIDGIPAWYVYARIAAPMLKPVFMTAVILLSLGVINSFDLVIALTQGGPGFSTDTPAKFVYEHAFRRSELGFSLAAATAMLVTTLVVIVPYLIWNARSKT